MTLIAALDRFNAAHPWSHNEAFSRFVLVQARAVRRAGGTTAVDAGCGTGGLLTRLAAVFPTVIGIEPDAEAAAVARQRLVGASDARIEQRPFGTESPREYDLIVFIASLHHMPLRETLLKARTALSPGGRIVIVGVARETSVDVTRSLISVVLNPLVGLIVHPRRALVRPTSMTAPVAAPRESFDEIRAIAQDLLPGIRLRRRLFWRYTAVWAAPADR